MFSHKTEKIPIATIRRLALYVQVLEEMERNKIRVTSSGPLAEACGVNPSQVRKDLAYFGEFGVRGVGYHVTNLINAIKVSLGVNRKWTVVIVGIGNLGKSLLHYEEFKLRGFNIVGAYDSDPFKIGEKIYGFEVMCTSKLREAAKKEKIEIGILATPPERAQHAAERLVEAGVLGILNFVSTRVNVPGHVTIESVNFFHYLYSIAFKVSAS